MYARSTTIQARLSSIDDGIAHVRDVVLPGATGIEGCIGLSMLVDRESGRCIATTSWRTEQAMRASEQTIRRMRGRVAEILGGSPQVDEWEISTLHRDHQSAPGACVQATWLQLDPAQLDKFMDVYKMTSLPAVEGLAGFCSASLLVNRASGRAVSTIAFDDMHAMQRSREQTSAMRATIADEAAAKMLETRSFDLALAHLRVPEMA